MVATAQYSSNHHKNFDPDTLSAGGLFSSIMVLADLAHAHLFSELRHTFLRAEISREISLPVILETDDEIPHARLGHFASQIGHWHISSMVKNHNR